MRIFKVNPVFPTIGVGDILEVISSSLGIYNEFHVRKEPIISGFIGMVWKLKLGLHSHSQAKRCNLDKEEKEQATHIEPGSILTF